MMVVFTGGIHFLLFCCNYVDASRMITSFHDKVYFGSFSESAHDDVTLGKVDATVRGPTRPNQLMSSVLYVGISSMQ